VMWGAWATGMAAADAAILQRFERLGMGSIKPAAGLAALAAALSTPMADAQVMSQSCLYLQTARAAFYCTQEELISHVNAANSG
jgi:hypothetical protein